MTALFQADTGRERLNWPAGARPDTVCKMVLIDPKRAVANGSSGSLYLITIPEKRRHKGLIAEGIACEPS
jgi:hypothetical protein